MNGQLNLKAQTVNQFGKHGSPTDLMIIPHSNMSGEFVYLTNRESYSATAKKSAQQMVRICIFWARSHCSDCDPNASWRHYLVVNRVLYANN